jgi:hypothetical protein
MNYKPAEQTATRLQPALPWARGQRPEAPTPDGGAGWAGPGVGVGGVGVGGRKLTS